MPFPSAPRILRTSFAAGGSRNEIPDTQATSGDGYASFDVGFPAETQIPISAGGIPPRRGDMNGILNILSTLMLYLGAGPVYYPFSNVHVSNNNGYDLGAIIRPDLQNDGRILISSKNNNTDNPNSNPAIIGSSWLRFDGIVDYNPGVNHYEGEFVIYPANRHCYRCIRIHGPQFSIIAEPTDTTYWESLAEYVTRMGGGGGGGGGSGGDGTVTFPYYPGGFLDFFERTPPDGWRIRNGQLISNASSICPQLWQALQLQVNSWKLVSESQWQNMVNTAPFNGVGGCPYFVLNIGSNTIRLPDTRGMYKEDSGFNGLTVGDAHGDTIRNMVGRMGVGATTVSSGGVLRLESGTLRPRLQGQDNSLHLDMVFQASFAVPTGPVVQPKAFGVLGCVYVGPPAE